VIPGDLYKLGPPYVIYKTTLTLDLAWPMYIPAYGNAALLNVHYELEMAKGSGDF
jgi:hypothetical protein